MKQKLIIVHGALGSADQLHPIAIQLQKEFEVHNLELPGHGKTSAPEQFSIEFFSEYILEYIRLHNMDRANFFGYSMGGYVGLWIASHHPGKIEKLVTYGTKLSWSPEIAQKEITMLDPQTIETKIPAFAKQLSERHTASGWKILLEKTAGLMLDLGNKAGDHIPYDQINIPVMLMLGDRDKMVSLKETETVFRQLKYGQMAVLPNQPHPLEKTDTSMMSYLITRFLE